MLRSRVHSFVLTTATTKSRSVCLYTTSTTTTTNADSNKAPLLEWETFEFSRKPKSDQRFLQQQQQQDDDDNDDNESNNNNNNNNKHQLWQSVSDDQIKDSIATLQPYVTPARLARMQSVLQQRTQNVRFLFENPANPSNVFACLRTLDSFGIQFADLFLQPSLYQGSMALSQKKGVKTAMGSAQWMTLQQYVIADNDAPLATTLREYKQQHQCRVYASCLAPDAQDIRDIVWPPSSDNDDETTICIVMGNEERGISPELMALADERFTLPMVGFAESFNLSVATAITCAHLSTQPNVLKPNLSPQQQRLLLLQGMIHSIPQKRMSKALLKQAGIVLPHDLLG